MQELWITTLASFITGIATWLVSRKQKNTEISKLKAEINGNELDNVEKAVKIWRDLAEDLTTKLKTLTEKCTWLEGEVDSLIKENRALKEQIASLTETIRHLQE